MAQVTGFPPLDAEIRRAQRKAQADKPATPALYGAAGNGRGILTVPVSPAMQEEFRALLVKHKAEFEAMCDKHGVPLDSVRLPRLERLMTKDDLNEVELPESLRVF